MVTHDSRQAVARTLPALRAELREGDELIVADNASSDGTIEAVEQLDPEATCIRRPENDGFAAACNDAAAISSGDLLVFLNPDASPAPGFGEAIRRPLGERRGWWAWMGLVTMDGGARINTSGGVVHFTGISWAGQVGQPVERAPMPREVAFASGACLAVPREQFERVGGFPAGYFLYYEDVELSLRMRLAGGVVGIEPAARVDHDYEFAKGPLKWRMLERNRWATILRTYPGPLLALVAPALLVTEAALLAVAFAGGWGTQKLRASAETLAALPRLLRERRAVQGARTATTREFAAHLTAELDSPYLGGPARVRPVRWALRAYWRLVLAALGAGARGRRAGRTGSPR